MIIIPFPGAGMLHYYSVQPTCCGPSIVLCRRNCFSVGFCKRWRGLWVVFTKPGMACLASNLSMQLRNQSSAMCIIGLSQASSIPAISKNSLNPNHGATEDLSPQVTGLYIGRGKGQQRLPIVFLSSSKPYDASCRHPIIKPTVTPAIP